MASHILIQDPNMISGRFSTNQAFGNVVDYEDLDNFVEKAFRPEDETDLAASLGVGSNIYL